MHLFNMLIKLFPNFFLHKMHINAHATDVPIILNNYILTWISKVAKKSMILKLGGNISDILFHI